MSHESLNHDQTLKQFLAESSPEPLTNAFTDALMQKVASAPIYTPDAQTDNKWSNIWTLVAFIMVPIAMLTLPWLSNSVSELINGLLPNFTYLAYFVVAVPSLALLFYRIDSLSQEMMQAG